MKRFVLTMMLILLSGGFSFGSQYTYSNGYYFDASGQAYTQSAVDSGYYAWNGCKWVWYPNVTYTYSKVQLDPSAPDAETQLLKLAAARDKFEGQLRLEAQRHQAFLEKVDKLGLTGNFNWKNYGNGSALYPSGVVNSINLGNYGVTGSTAYGYSYQQVADLYGTTDLNTLFQQSSALAKNAQSLAGQANSEFNANVQTATNGANRAAEIREEGRAAVAKLAAVAPASRITTSISQTGVAPAVMPKIEGGGDTQQLKSATANNSCIICHSSAKASGGLDLGKPLTADQYLKILNRISLPVSDPKHMPQSADGKPGRQLNANEIRDLLP